MGSASPRLAPSHRSTALFGGEAAGQMLEKARAEIDFRFGDGFAREHPSLLEAFLHFAASHSDGGANIFPSSRVVTALDDGSTKDGDVTPPSPAHLSGGLPPCHMLPRQALSSNSSRYPSGAYSSLSSESSCHKRPEKRFAPNPKARRRVGWR